MGYKQPINIWQSSSRTNQINSLSIQNETNRITRTWILYPWNPLFTHRSSLRMSAHALSWFGGQETQSWETWHEWEIKNQFGQITHYNYSSVGFNSLSQFNNFMGISWKLITQAFQQFREKWLFSLSIKLKQWNNCLCFVIFNILLFRYK